MYAMPDRSLPDAIVALQRQELPGETRRLAEEAALLLSDGHEIEAKALVEKAQALAAIGVRVPANGSPKPEAGKPADESSLPQLAARLAAPIAAAIANALLEVERYSTDQARVLAKGVDDRVAQLTCEIAGMKKADEALGTGITTITDHVAEHEQRLTAIDGFTAGFKASIVSLNERVDRQTESLRAIQERQMRRAAVLNEVLGSIAKLREHGSHESEPNNPASQ